MTTERRYQVFISSTFRDLIAERQAVLKAALELDHMPAGMELFPAADDSAWSLIKDVIDASDYYVLIIGGRYGSLDADGIGYTEKEYDYAHTQKKPVIPLLHKNPNNLPRGQTETNQDAWKRLEAFRRKVEDRHTCVYWDSAEDLKAHVIVGLTSTIKRNPAVGWVRADQVAPDATLADVLALKTRVAELEGALEQSQTAPPPGTEDLLQGDDTFDVEVHFESRRPGTYLSLNTYSSNIEPSWNEIFAGIAPSMINEISAPDLRNSFRGLFTRIAHEDFDGSEGVEGMELINFRYRDDQLVDLPRIGGHLR